MAVQVRRETRAAPRGRSRATEPGVDAQIARLVHEACEYLTDGRSCDRQAVDLAGHGADPAGAHLGAARAYVEAAKRFQAALDVAPRSVDATLGLARTCAHLRGFGSGEPRETALAAGFDLSKGAVTGLLARAVELTPKTRRKALLGKLRLDRDLAAVRDTLYFQLVVAGRDPTTRAGAIALLEAVTWYLDADTSPHPAPCLELRRAGSSRRAELTRFDPDTRRTFRLLGNYAIALAAGRPEVLVTFDDPDAVEALGTRELRAVLLPDGSLEWPARGWRFRDDPRDVTVV